MILLTEVNDTFTRVLDCIDLETFFICQDEREAKDLMLSLLSHMGFSHGDIVFVQHEGPGARVRGRAYVHRPDEVPPYFAAKEEVR